VATKSKTAPLSSAICHPPHIITGNSGHHFPPNVTARIPAPAAALYAYNKRINVGKDEPARQCQQLQRRCVDCGEAASQSSVLKG